MKERGREESAPMKAARAAFPHTVPVLAGFLFLGVAYGMLMQSKGYGALWSMLMSAVVYAGSMQYVAVALLAAPFAPLSALMMTLIVNARHLFYGVSMLDRLKGTGKFKPYLIFTLCDETFSILVSTDPPEGIDRTLFMFFVALFNQLYWVAGSTAGALLGSLARFNTEGLDFALTALFVVILTNQVITAKSRKPQLVGMACSLACLMVFGNASFVIPSMITIIAALMAFKSDISAGLGKEAQS